jgi:hypothetical protein
MPPSSTSSGWYPGIEDKILEQSAVIEQIGEDYGAIGKLRPLRKRE